MRTIVIGLDAFDPHLFERLLEEGRMPNLGRFVQRDAYAQFSVSNPPQSEVSWTSIATGLGPGEHGMFDFVHRDPSTYSVFASLLPTKKTIGGVQFAPPFNANTLFDAAVSQGYQATSLWWPATFPARPQTAVRTIPGLGTPDILGKLGVGTLYSSESNSGSADGKVPCKQLVQVRRDRFNGTLFGPSTKNGQSMQQVFELQLHGDKTAQLQIGRQRIDLQLGQWSPILNLTFSSGLLSKVGAITRVILVRSAPAIDLYVLPLQIFPLKSPWPYGTPGSFLKKTWQETGPFLTLGWPQDTTALEEGYIDDEQFLALCSSIFEQRKLAFLYHLQQFEEGVLACVFDTLDRIQHMFLRDRADIVEAWYERCDQLVGDALKHLSRLKSGKKTRVIILSDHGFAPFDFKVHLNRWLIDHGFLAGAGHETAATLRDVDWRSSSAYAVGLNSLYLNLHEREGQGTVPLTEREQRLNELRQKLMGWRGPNGSPVVAEALPHDVAFPGSLADHAPDLFVGYSPGYRASQATGLGGWAAASIEENSDHWGADHCMHAAAVPGVIFASHGLLKTLEHPSYSDIPYLATGIEPKSGGSAPPPISSGGEDDTQVEERLRSLGYL